MKHKISLWLQSSLKSRKFGIILPWCPQHERVWCSTALAAIQSSWEVNCNAASGIQPSPPVLPTSLLLRAEVSQVEPQALQDTDIHKPVFPLFHLDISLLFAEFPSWPKQLQARQVFAVANHLTLWAWRRQNVFPGFSLQTDDSSLYQKNSCWF